MSFPPLHLFYCTWFRKKIDIILQNWPVLESFLIAFTNKKSQKVSKTSGWYVVAIGDHFDQTEQLS